MNILLNNSETSTFQAALRMSMSFSVQRRVSTMTTRLFNSAGVDNGSDSRAPHEFTLGGGRGGEEAGYDGGGGSSGDDDVSEFSLRVTSIPPPGE